MKVIASLVAVWPLQTHPCSLEPLTSEEEVALAALNLLTSTCCLCFSSQRALLWFRKLLKRYLWGVGFLYILDFPKRPSSSV